MKSKKYPDHIVWDEEKEQFNAHILPYGSNISAPVIELVNTDAFKNKGVSKVKKIFDSELEEIAKKYYDLVEEVELNNMIYNSNYSFEPIIGEVYHLYENKNNEMFLSLISPLEWNEKHITSVRLNSEYKWVSIKDL
jgi:hypothetical protein